MRYTQTTFTLPTASVPMTDEAYEIAVGLRCPDCRMKLDVPGLPGLPHRCAVVEIAYYRDHTIIDTVTKEKP